MKRKSRFEASRIWAFSKFFLRESESFLSFASTSGWSSINPFHATGLFLCENQRFFDVFRGAFKEASGMKWVKEKLNVYYDGLISRQINLNYVFSIDTNFVGKIL